MEVTSKGKQNSDKKGKTLARDSFAKRRKLFKSIFETVVNIEEHENAKKPKVIKTQRLDEVNCINIGLNKKQHMKNLRTVCTRLLDCCDRHDAENICPTRNDTEEIAIVTHSPKAKKKRVRKKMKIHRTFSYVPCLPVSEPGTDKFQLSFDCKEEGSITHRGTRPQRDISSPRLKRALLVQQFLTERSNLEHPPAPPPPALVSPVPSEKMEYASRKVIKKKQHKIKKTSALIPAPLPRVNIAHSKKVPINSWNEKK